MVNSIQQEENDKKKERKPKNFEKMILMSTKICRKEKIYIELVKK